MAYATGEVGADDHGFHQAELMVTQPGMHTLLFRANLSTLVGQLLQRNRKQIKLALHGRGFKVQALEQHGLQHTDVFGQRTVCAVRRLGKSLLQCFIHCTVNGDLDHSLLHGVRTREILKFTRI